MVSEIRAAKCRRRRSTRGTSASGGPTPCRPTAPSPPSRCGPSTPTASSSCRDVFTADEVAAVRAVIDGFEAEAEAALRRARRRPDVHRRGRAPSPSPPTSSPARRVLAAFAQHPAFAGHGRRPGRARRRPLLGPGRLQEAGEAPPLPLAPGQRLRLRRAPAVPDVLGAAHRRPARERLPAGRPRPAPAGHARPPLRRPAGLRVLPRAAGRRGRGRGRRGRRHRVQLAHAPPHRAQPHRRGPQGLHPPVLAGRRRGARGRSPAPAPRPVGGPATSPATSPSPAPAAPSPGHDGRHGRYGQWP